MSQSLIPDDVIESLALKLAALDLTDVERDALDLIMMRSASYDASEVVGFEWGGSTKRFDEVTRPDGRASSGRRVDLDTQSLRTVMGFTPGED